VRYLVDGNNVMGARPDGWWKDRVGAVRRLAADLARLATSGHQVTVVFDGAELDDLPEGTRDGVVVFYAGRSGRDAADDRIVELADADPDPSTLTVVTSDGALAEQVRGAGAQVTGAGRFLDALE